MNNNHWGTKINENLNKNINKADKLSLLRLSKHNKQSMKITIYKYSTYASLYMYVYLSSPANTGSSPLIRTRFREKMSKRVNDTRLSY